MKAIISFGFYEESEKKFYFETIIEKNYSDEWFVEFIEEYKKNLSEFHIIYKEVLN